jgi:hypothetical protein
VVRGKPKRHDGPARDALFTPEFAAIGCVRGPATMASFLRRGAAPQGDFIVPKLVRFVPVLVVLLACDTGAPGTDPTSNRSPAVTGKTDLPADDTLARFRCTPSGGTTTFEDFSEKRVTAAVLDMAYGIADLTVETQDVETGYLGKESFTGDRVGASELSGGTASAVWDDDDTRIELTSTDGETFTSGEFGFTLYEDFPIEVSCKREALPDSALLRMHVLKNLAEVEQVGSAQINDDGVAIDLNAYSIDCIASSNFPYGASHVGVCKAEGDLGYPNSSSAFAVAVSVDDGDDAFPMRYQVIRLASEL